MIVWHLLADPSARFHDLGPDFYATHVDPERRKRGHIRHLAALRWSVRYSRDRLAIRYGSLSARSTCDAGD